MDINRYTPNYCINNKHMTKLADYSSEELFELLYATRQMKAKHLAHDNTAILNGTTVALLFGGTSIRTRSALKIGIKQLGGEALDLPYNENDLMIGENVEDMVFAFDKYGIGALITRGIGQVYLDKFTKTSPLTIINSANSDFAPIQAVCDLYTIWEKKKRLEGLKIAYVGKGSNVLSSLAMGAVKCGMQVAIATPSAYALKPEHLESAEQYGTIEVTDDPAIAVKNADIIYTDSYHYHSQMTPEEAEIMAPYKINNRLLAMASGTALFMHPLPARRGVEVSPEVIDGKQSVIYDQAENKLHAVKAILALLVK
ncbi:MAG: ornithine carbamoyltransferase [Candidatus Coproplasma sp.]